MSDLSKYIFDKLEKNYNKLEELSKTAFSSSIVYEHKSSHNKLVLISSLNRNDDIYRILKAIDCPNLPKIYEVCSDEEYLYVLEEYIEGVVLSEKEAELNGNIQTACKYMTDVCNALSKLHEKNIVHRDVKPSNIIINSADTAVLIDYDIARLMSDSKTGDTQNLGTVGYAAPEQFGIIQSGPATDIYPIGVMLNEVILSVHPTVDIPKGKVGKIISRCVTTQMSKRYRSVAELGKELSKLT